MSKKAVLILQIVPILLLVLFFTQIFLQIKDYSLVMFKQIGEPVLYLLLSLIFLYEIIFIIISAIINKKYSRLLFILILIVPLLLNGLLYGLAHVNDYHEIKIEEHDEKLLLVSHSFLLLGTSYVYQKSNFLICKEIAIVDGNNGHRPLSNQESYTYEIDGNIIIFTYYYGKQNPEAKLYLQYDGNSYSVIN